jgi:ribosomal protein S18 acetylase RimI-like enzyme
VLYRLYTPEDFGALYAIEEICFKPPLRFGRAMMRWLIYRPNSATWIAERDGEMAGFGLCEWSWEAGETVAYIHTIEVAPALRGQGMGGELLTRMEASAHEAGAGLIRLHVDEKNTGAIHLYQAHGYLCVGREESYYGPWRAALKYSKPFAAPTVG